MELDFVPLSRVLPQTSTTGLLGALAILPVIQTLATEAVHELPGQLPSQEDGVLFVRGMGMPYDRVEGAVEREVACVE